MTFRPATARELKAWRKWLKESHGLRDLPGKTLHYCNYDYPMLLVPWPRFDGLTIRVERCSDQPVVSFDLVDGTRTIAEIWTRPENICARFSNQSEIEALRSILIESAAAGRIWWGMEYPIESTFITSLVRYFPEGFLMPDQAKQALKSDPPLSVLETSLDLV